MEKKAKGTKKCPVKGKIKFKDYKDRIKASKKVFGRRKL